MSQANHRTVLILVLGLLALPTVAAATEPTLSYDHVELLGSHRSYGTIFRLETPSAVATTATRDDVGLGVAGSVQVHRHLYLRGTYLADLGIDITTTLSAAGEISVATSVLDSRYARFAVGTRIPLGARLDLNAELGAENAAFRLPGVTRLTLPSGDTILEATDVSVDEIEPDVLIGLRYLAGRHLELQAHARYSRVQLRDVAVDGNRIQLRDDVLFGVGVMANLGRRIGIGVRWEGGDVETATAQLRWRF